ncbi:MAG: multicopper oxidase domain-containing protein [Sulfurovum sp.]|nr:multicopper oxidase domain-containing protein [Sulfurovum sp.]
MQRREFLTLSSVTAIAILTGCGGGGGDSSNNTENTSSSLTPKNKALPIPNALYGTGTGSSADPKQYDLTIQSAQHDFFNETDTSTYAVDGSFLGPTLFLRNGENVSINYTNTLSEKISMHGHGMHLPAAMDGTAHQEFLPGDTWSAQYQVNQKACTNWYHPHTLHKTAEHVYKGIAGLIIIEDSESDALDLPKRYGEDDIPLVLQDRKFDTNGQIVYNPSNMEIMRGYVGDTFIANGAIEPTFDAEAKEIRFRILNGSNSTVYELGFSDGRSFKQIATDNAFLETPVSMTRLTLSPAERAEIVVDFSGDLNSSLELREYNHGKTFVKINVSKNAQSVTTLPGTLTSLAALGTPVNTRSFSLEGSMGSFTINGQAMDITVINETVPVDQLEEWTITNNMNVDHNFHIHATHFRLVKRNGNTNIAANVNGYKDTVYIPAGENVTVQVKMTDYTDATVPYMYHCHFLEHEDNGMMGQFTVV